jgi:hypothetical protein
VALPPHTVPGGFDHAAVHLGTGRIYVAHTANDAVDIIDGSTRRYIESIGDLTAVAGALVSDEHNLLFTSNRGEDTVGIFSPMEHRHVTKVGVGVRPNGSEWSSRSRSQPPVPTASITTRRRGGCSARATRAC